MLRPSGWEVQFSIPTCINNRVLETDSIRARVPVEITSHCNVLLHSGEVYRTIKINYDDGSDDDSGDVVVLMATAGKRQT